MRTLYLLRHAKPVAPIGATQDFERPLSEGGRIQAKKIGNVIAAEKLIDASVISSPAVRARETIELVLSSARLTLATHFEPRIYEAELSGLLEVIGQIDQLNRVVLLVGHNPGMENLLRFLTSEIHAMAAATLAKVKVESDSWDLTKVSAQLEWLVVP